MSHLKMRNKRSAWAEAWMSRIPPHGSRNQFKQWLQCEGHATVGHTVDLVTVGLFAVDLAAVSLFTVDLATVRLFTVSLVTVSLFRGLDVANPCQSVRQSASQSVSCSVQGCAFHTRKCV